MLAIHTAVGTLGSVTTHPRPGVGLGSAYTSTHGAKTPAMKRVQDVEWCGEPCAPNGKECRHAAAGGGETRVLQGPGLPSVRRPEESLRVSAGDQRPSVAWATTLMNPPPITAEVRNAGPVPSADAARVLKAAAGGPSTHAVANARYPRTQVFLPDKRFLPLHVVQPGGTLRVR